MLCGFLLHFSGKRITTKGFRSNILRKKPTLRQTRLLAGLYEIKQRRNTTFEKICKSRSQARLKYSILRRYLFGLLIDVIIEIVCTDSTVVITSHNSCQTCSRLKFKLLSIKARSEYGPRFSVVAVNYPRRYEKKN